MKTYIFACLLLFSTLANSLSVEEESEGVECNYIPEYCAWYNASAYEVFPTDADGLCPKRPNLGYNDCTDQVLTAYCGYCVFIENNNEKRYVAAEIETEIQCELNCNEATTMATMTTTTYYKETNYDEDDLQGLSEKELCEKVDKIGRFRFFVKGKNSYTRCKEICAEYEVCTQAYEITHNWPNHICTLSLDDEMCKDLLGESASITMTPACKCTYKEN